MTPPARQACPRPSTGPVPGRTGQAEAAGEGAHQGRRRDRRARPVGELSYLHSRDITYAVLCQGPYDVSSRYRDFMGWDMPWYSAADSVGTLLSGRQAGLFHLVCYLRDGDRVYETYWTTGRGAEAMDYSYALMDLTVFGRQEGWEDSPPGWPPRLARGCPDDLTG